LNIYTPKIFLLGGSLVKKIINIKVRHWRRRQTHQLYTHSCHNRRCIFSWSDLSYDFRQEL